MNIKDVKILINRCLVIGITIFLTAACQKPNNTVSIGKNPVLPANAITKDTLQGTIKGVIVSGKTYYVIADIVVNPLDTLTIQPGVKVIILNTATFIINGTLSCIGTQSNLITFTAPDNNINAGAWGGLECDSSNNVTIQWTNIEYGGAPGDGKINGNTGTQYPVSCRKSGATFVFEDSRIANFEKAGIRVASCNINISRNTFEYMGVSGGDAITVLNGVTGIIAYNYIWSSAANAMNIQTSTTILYPQTNINVYNNTIINNGWRNTTKPGSGVVVDLFAQGNYYNNIFVNCRQGLRITQLADTAHVNYGSNLFFATVDSFKNYFYPIGDAGKEQPSDLWMVNPQLVSLDKNINNTVNTNDPHLLAGSPAINTGNALYNKDIGAYTSDGNGHK